MSIPSHNLVDGLRRDESGICARCTCGWVSRGHFTSLAASAAFRDHIDAAQKPQPHAGKLDIDDHRNQIRRSDEISPTVKRVMEKFWNTIDQQDRKG